MPCLLHRLRSLVCIITMSAILAHSRTYLDYWTSVIFKQLVGENVLSVAGSTDAGRMTRVYAFCSLTYPGGVVAVALNINTTSNATFQFNFAMSPRLEYQLTAPGGDVSSQQIELNGVVLTAQPDGSLPALTPIAVDDGAPITMYPLSYGFFVFPQANAPACQ